VGAIFGHRPKKQEDISTSFVELATGCEAQGFYGKNKPRPCLSGKDSVAGARFIRARPGQSVEPIVQLPA